MLFTTRAFVGFELAVCIAASVDARQWTDVTGTYSIEADLIAFNEGHAFQMQSMTSAYQLR